MNIFVLNSGSSSIKCALFVLKDSHHFTKPAWEASLRWKGRFEDPLLEIESSNQKKSSKIDAASPEKALETILNLMIRSEPNGLTSLSQIDAVGHRIVHGGRFYRESIPINDEVKKNIRNLAEYAPLHNMAAFRGIEEMQRLLKGKPEIAVFDTAFHHTLLPEATIYPGPYRWFEEGIQRYGFHGISYQYCSRRALEMMHQPKKSKIVICHLGAGASLCAVENGISIDTTMGFTPLEGLMMNTRSGSIDPGIILERLKHTTLSDLTNELNRESGLLGISGISSDMRDILKNMQNGHPRAKIAFDLYLYRLRSCIGSMIASLQGFDALAFTAGIGENTPLLRQRICDSLAFLGVAIDPKKNEKTLSDDSELSSRNSKVKVYLIHTQESFEIARECLRLNH